MIYMSDSAEIALTHRKQCIFLIKIILSRCKGLFLELLGPKYGQMSCLAKNISPKSKIFQFSSVYHALCISFVVQTYLIICLYILKQTCTRTRETLIEVTFKTSPKQSPQMGVVTRTFPWSELEGPP